MALARRFDLLSASVLFMQVCAIDLFGADLIGHWPFEEGSGTMAGDSSGNGNHAALFNGPVWSTGRVGGALTLDGSNDYVRVPDSASLDNIRSAITIAAWVNRSGGGWSTAPVLTRQVGTGQMEHYYLGFLGGNYCWFVNTETGGYSNFNLGGAAPVGQWIHLVGTYDGAQVKLYVNGAEHFSTPHSGPIAAAANPVMIGAAFNSASGSAQEFLGGMVDDVRLYDRALTAAEAQALFTGTAPHNQPPNVSLTSPTTGSAFTAPASITIAASASDTDGSIGRVEFYEGSTKIGERVLSPYSLVWSNVAAGSYSLTARATDNSGASTTSSAVSITVNNSTPGDTTPPVRSNGAPAGTLPEGTTQTTISLSTNEAATCRYATAAGVSFASMTNTFASTGATSHSTPVSGLNNGASYTFHVRCQDSVGNVNPDDYAISVTIAQSTGGGGGLIGHWPFEEGSGTMAGDSSGNGNHAALFNGPVWSTGRVGGALTLDGSNDYVRVPDSASLDNIRSAITIAAWVNRSGGGWSTAPVLTRQVGTGQMEHYYLGFLGGNYCWFVNTETGGYSNFNLGGAAPVGQWIHLVGTYDGAQVKLYVNGAEHFSTPHSGPIAAAANPVMIGAAFNSASGSAQEFLGGMVDDVRLYDRALTAAEAQALFTGTAPHNQPPNVSLTSPTTGSAFTAPASITIAASASDTDGSIGRVEFYEGSTKIGERVLSPYSLVWSNVAAGSYSLTARATDNSGASTTSSAVSITVNNSTPGDTTPPVRSNGAPAGTLPEGTTQTTISLSTNEAATCRYATAAGVSFASMTNTFASTGATSHSTPVSGLNNGASYTFHVRCQDSVGNVNPDDYAISVTIAQSTGGGGGLIGHWPFEEGSGTMAGDSSGNGNHAALFNGPVWSTGRVGGALTLDGSNDYVRVPDSASLDNIRSAITIAAWVNRSGGGWSTAPVLTRQVGTGQMEHYYLGFLGGNYCWFVNTETGGYSNFNLGGAAPVGQWIHLVGTYDGAQVKLYVNGAEHFSTPHSGPIAAAANPVMIGAAFNSASGSAQEFLGGMVDDVRLYDRALTAAEAQALYNSAPRSTRVMPLGDSITDGFNIPGGYRIDLWSKFVAVSQRVDFVGSAANGPASLGDRDHEGHSGFRIDGISSSVVGWLSATKPDIVLLKIGTNDVYQNHQLSSAPARLSSLIDQITTTLPNAHVVVASIVPFADSTLNQRAITYNSAIPDIVSTKISQGKKVSYVDMFSALTAADLADGVHPNSAGYSKMANVWYATLNPLLSAQ